MKAKLISWNVNGIRAVERKGDLFNFMEAYDPDVLFMQEIKGNVEQFSEGLVVPEGYETFYHSAEKKGYSGTGIWVKHSFLNKFSEFEFFSGMPGDSKFEDIEGRVARLRLKTKEKKIYHLMGIYFPNGGKSDAAFEGKLVFYDDFLKGINQLRDQKEVCIWGGDVNCAHNEIDLARPKDNDGAVGFHPKERAWMDRLDEQGWVDVWRKTYPEKAEVYSWWNYYTRSRERNVGWRIDYWYCDEKTYPTIKEVKYLHDQLGSDHCPIAIEVDLD